MWKSVCSPGRDRSLSQLSVSSACDLVMEVGGSGDVVGQRGIPLSAIMG